MSNRLFDDDDQSDEETTFKTNKDYAKTYNTYRQKELLKKRKLYTNYVTAMSNNLHMCFHFSQR